MTQQQLPVDDEVFLDHVAHFVPDIGAVGALLTALGFRLTPLTAQHNQTAAGPVLAGMANRCVMLRQGYVEFLTAVSQTELAQRFRLAVQRYVGLHLIALSVADSDAAHNRLALERFVPDPPVHLRRALELPGGTPGEARFTVLRVPPEQMPEGRIQLLTHHSEEAVWQLHWLDHDNGVVSLEAVLIVVADPQEAAERFARFAGRMPERRQSGRWLLPLDRGSVAFFDGDALARLAPWAGRPPAVPWIAGYALGSVDPGLTDACFAAAGVPAAARAPGEVSYLFPPVLGGFATVVAPPALPSWAR